MKKIIVKLIKKSCSVSVNKSSRYTMHQKELSQNLTKLKK